MRNSSTLLLALLAGALCAAPAPSAATFLPQGTAAPGSVPGGINYQGQLQENGLPVNATWKFMFRIYDCGPLACGNLIETFGPMDVEIFAGLFSANIPVTTNTLVGGGQRWLEVEVDKLGGPGSGPTLTPRERLTTVPYALVAKTIEGTIDISTGGLSITTSPYSTNAAFYISSGTSFIGIGTMHPATLLHMSSGALTIDGLGAGFHLSSGAVAVDGAGAALDVRGAAYFGTSGPGRSGFDAAGNLQLGTALSLTDGGTGKDFSSAGAGGLLYFSGVGMSSTPLAGAGSILRSDGTVPAWSATAYPNTISQGELLYGSAANAVSALGTDTAGKLLRTNGAGANPSWTQTTYPDTILQGQLLYGSVGGNAVSALGTGTAGKLLRTNGAGVDPAWTTAVYPGTTTANWILYSDLNNRVTDLPTQNNGVLATNGAGVPGIVTAGGGSMVLRIPNAGGAPAFGAIDLSQANAVTGALSTANGGTGAVSSGAAVNQGSLPFFSNVAGMMTTLPPSTAGYVLKTNGAAANPSWADLSSIGTVNWANNLTGGAQGSVPYQSALDTTALLPAGTAGQLLRTAGAGANPTWTTAAYPNATTANQILYSDAANSVAGLATAANSVLVTNGAGAPTMSADLPAGFTIAGSTIFHSGGTPIPYAEGGTNADLSALGNGSLIYKTAGNLAGAVLTGVIKGNGAGAPTAMTGTANQVAYWIDANTIGSVATVDISSGGTGANLSAVATGGLIYKSGATTLGGTAALTGVLKGAGAGAPTAITGTANQVVYWVDANTIGATPTVSISSGGTGSDLSASAQGGLIYKGAAGLQATGQLNGVLKGAGAGAPTAINGTQNQITYWTDANTIGSTAAISVGLGGTGNDLSAVATGGLIYKSGATTLGGTAALTGVLKGTGAGAPTTADQDDLGDGATYKQYNPAAV
ncbi:MAG: hypothetical protein HY926_08330, partial [Elusimicrobia bacterium]|nr:hypothetical protein [Elusimicrobiota bacterium]